MRPPSRVGLFVVVLALFLAGSLGSSRAAPDDPAARGLDVFAAVPSRALLGGSLRLPLRTVGFRSATDSRPLPHAKVEVSWQGREATQTPVAAESDDQGLLTIDVPVPRDLGLRDGRGDTREASLVVGIVHGSHRRTRTLKVTVETPFELRVSLPSQSVRPGQKTSAWVRLLDRRTGAGAPSQRVDVSLTEGGVPVEKREATTDAAGTAMVELTIPKSEEGGLDWQLEASAVDVDATPISVGLAAADLTPARASLAAQSSKRRARIGEPVSFVIRAKSATLEPIAGLSVRAKLVPESASIPAVDAPEAKTFWQDAQALVTDDAGAASFTYTPPSTISGRANVHLVARATLEGREVVVEQAWVEIVSRATATIDVLPESGVLAPGLEQALLIEVKDGFGDPVSGKLRVKGDGLSQEVETDGSGWARVRWDVPLDVGTRRDRGPCSGTVAATVVVERAGEEPLSKCVSVDREQRALVRLAGGPTQAPSAVAGVATEVEVVALAERGEALGPALVDVGDTSVWLTRERDGQPSAGAGKGKLEIVRYRGKLTVPAFLSGVVQVRGAVLRDSRPALLATAALWITPPVLPSVSAKLVGGHTVPGGTAIVEARLSDQAQKPLVGAVAAMVVDAESGDYDDAFAGSDTRLGLCAELGIAASRCEAALRGALVPAIQGELAGRTRSPREPELDPGRTAQPELRAAFKTVLKSLEGGLYEASTGPDRVRDVMRKGPKGAEFNPELFTVVTQALIEPPLLPGGVPITLADLTAIDPQVTFDKVGRRVARYKLFKLLSATRGWRTSHDLLDADEPALKDPNALLRIWRDEQAGALYDPWGGAFTFQKRTSQPSRAFLSPIPGWVLVSPGPDGRVGNADDVVDPFERVLASKTPYAEALAEDRIVDAWADLRVADASVAAWSRLLEENTGTMLGSEGSGFGSGSGRLGGSHRSKAPSIRMGATSVTRAAPFGAWIKPTRTDDSGVARIEVPLGGDETRYRVVILGVPDRAGTAVGWVDVPTALPLSVRVRPVEGLIDGDAVALAARIQNRTSAAIRAKVSFSVSGAGALAKDVTGREIDVPAMGSARLSVGVVARGRGELRLRAQVEGGGQKDDSELALDVAPRGVIADLGRARFVSSSTTLDLFAPGEGKALEGSPRVVVESGAQALLDKMLAERWIDGAASAEQATDALELYGRAESYARTVRGAAGERYAARAKSLLERAAGRYQSLRRRESDALRGDATDRRAMRAHARTWGFEVPPECPADGEASESALLALAEAEPDPNAGAVPACWDARVSSALGRASASKDPVAMARLVLAFVDRPHRATLGAELAAALATTVKLDPAGHVSLEAAESREARAIVYAALARATHAGWVKGAPEEVLLGWLEVQRGADGAFGSLRATRLAFGALLVLRDASRASALSLTPLDKDGDPIGAPRKLALEAGRGTLELPAEAASVRVETDAPVLVRLERRALLGYATRERAGATPAPYSVALRYPTTLSAGQSARVEISLRAPPGQKRALRVRLPLPAGASLAEPLSGVRAVPGALILDVESDESGVVLPTLVPLRFACAGRVLAPPATLVDSDRTGASASSLATVLEVKE